jgi:hypothetical protein
LLKVETDLTIDQFEDGLRTIAQGEPLLMVPTKLTANAVGISASLLQLIITWARQAPADSSTLRLHAPSLDSEALTNFAQSPWGLTALDMAKQVQLVTGQPIEWRDVLLRARKFVVAMHSGSLADLRELNKNVIPIMCVDNATDYRRPRRLYNQATGKVLDRTAFEDLTAASLRVLRPQRHVRIDRDLLEAVASLLQETFQNTDEHAQADFFGNRYRRSVRGILFSYQYVKLDKLREMAGSSEPLLQYYDSWRPARAGAQHAQFLEVSIFDSGSGLAQKWLGKQGKINRPIVDEPIALGIEYDAVLSCLRKGGTTKAHDTRGNGLYRVMQAVKRSGGFIRMRTGRLSLVKTFSFGADPTPSPDDIRMDDLRHGGEPERQRAWADGTVITVMIPLNRGS